MEGLLGQVADAQQAVADLQRDLAEHRDTLCQGLEQLHRTVAARAADGRLTLPEPAKVTAAVEEPAPEELAPATKRRRRARRAGNPIAVSVQHTGRGQPPFAGWVIDRSAGGVCRLVDEELLAGTRVELRPAGTARSFQAEVGHCWRDGTHRKAGCACAEPLAWVDLRLFG